MRSPIGAFHPGDHPSGCQDLAEELTEHPASSTAIVQVLAGRLMFTAEGDESDALPGFWLHMDARTPHALFAVEPSVMLLTLVRR